MDNCVYYDCHKTTHSFVSPTKHVPWTIVFITTTVTKLRTLSFHQLNMFRRQSTDYGFDEVGRYHRCNERNSGGDRWSTYAFLAVVEDPHSSVPVVPGHDEAHVGRRAGVGAQARVDRHLVVVLVARTVVQQRRDGPL